MIRLNTLNAGTITTAQFLDLNEKIGGVDEDSAYTGARSAGDPGRSAAHTRRADARRNSGLTAIPNFDNATSNETGGYHYGWLHFALRERWSGQRRQFRHDGHGAAFGQRGPLLFDQWVAAYKDDSSSDRQRVKVLRAKPADAVDGCFDTATPPKFIADALPFTSKPASKCSELYPVYSNPRKEAGGPLAANIIKCQLKPVDAKDYRATFTPAEMTRLIAIFPGGVCDWSKPGVNQTPVVTWASLGPSPKNLIFSRPAARLVALIKKRRCNKAHHEDTKRTKKTP